MDAATTCNVLAWAMIITAMATFVTTLAISAPYGRYSTAKGWGPLIPAKTAWFFMESPNLWVPGIIYVHFSSASCASNPYNNRLIVMFLIHYINRAVLYPLRMPRDANPMPISVSLMAFLYCIWNGLTQSLALGVVHCEDSISGNSAAIIRFYLGVLIFFMGMAINVHADSTLLHLRGKPINGRRQAYKIPTGGMFEYVSCANYFGEILEWFGYAVASWSIAAAAFAIFTFCNIGPRAYNHHKWYLQKFEDYPKSRKAVIPYVW